MFFPGAPDRVIAVAIREAFCHAAEELVLGRATRVTLTLLPSGRFSVQDDGRGWPTNPEQEFPTAIHRIATCLHAGCRADHALKSVHEHVCVMSLASLNALCSAFTVDNFADGRHMRLRFRAGRAVTPLHLVGPTSLTGVRITFTPDYKLIGPQRLAPQSLRRWWNALPLDIPRRSFHVRHAN